MAKPVILAVDDDPQVLRVDSGPPTAGVLEGASGRGDLLRLFFLDGDESSSRGAFRWRIGRPYFGSCVLSGVG